MRDDTDYYVVLQVDPRAEEEVIDAAYRRLAVKYHPDRDRSPGANNRMKAINAAYEVLSNPQRRRDYDLRRTGFSAWGSGKPSVGPRKSYNWWPMALTGLIALMTVLSRSPMLLMFLLILLTALFLLWWLGRPNRG